MVGSEYFKVRWSVGRVPRLALAGGSGVKRGWEWVVCGGVERWVGMAWGLEELRRNAP